VITLRPTPAKGAVAANRGLRRGRPGATPLTADDGFSHLIPEHLDVDVILSAEALRDDRE
jgi:hypothetical protein